MSRKTFSVETLRQRVNYILLNSDDTKVGERNSAMALLEGVLHDTGNYNGFGYLDDNAMACSLHGESLGIDRNRHVTEQFENTDRTRVHYY